MRPSQGLVRAWYYSVSGCATEVLPVHVPPPQRRAGVAQSVEQLIRNQQVISSSLIAGSMKSRTKTSKRANRRQPIRAFDTQSDTLTAQARYNEALGRLWLPPRGVESKVSLL